MDDKEEGRTNDATGNKEPRTRTIGTKRYTWYFSGNQENADNRGVAIVIRNEIRNYPKGIKPISSRLMTANFHGTVQINFVNAYAPTAEASANHKNEFYNEIEKSSENLKTKASRCQQET